MYVEGATEFRWRHSAAKNHISRIQTFPIKFYFEPPKITFFIIPMRIWNQNVKNKPYYDQAKVQRTTYLGFFISLGRRGFMIM